MLRLTNITPHTTSPHVTASLSAMCQLKANSTDWHHTQPHPLESCSLPPPSNHYVGLQTPTVAGLWEAPSVPSPHPSHCDWHATDLHRMTDLIKECNMESTPSNTHFVPLPPSSLQKGQIEVVTHVQWSKQSVQYTTQTHHMPQHTDLLLAGTGWHKCIDKVTLELHSEGQLSWTMRNS